MRKRKTIKPKEYIWTLDINGEKKLWKCLVTQTECVTYEGDVERKHLKIMNPVRKEAVLQIDTITVVYGRQTPFQLENGIPYLQLDDHWEMSDTTRDDRFAKAIQIQRNRSTIESIFGTVLLIAALLRRWLTGGWGDWWMLMVLGLFFFASATVRMIRLKKELSAMEKTAEDGTEPESPESLNASEPGEE